MEKLWRSGENIAIRGIVNERVWYAKSTIVVKDSLDETVLLLSPGSQCVYSEGYFRWKHGDYSQGSRWEDAKSNEWKFRILKWVQNRILIFLEPQKYYSIYYIWADRIDQFIGYYVNFQLPYRRCHCGFDSLDLDLDLVIDPDFRWRWKDKEEYIEGIREGGIKASWVYWIEQSYQEIFSKIKTQNYPLDGSWQPWRPDPLWEPSILPEKWRIL